VYEPEDRKASTVSSLFLSWVFFDRFRNERADAWFYVREEGRFVFVRRREVFGAEPANLSLFSARLFLLMMSLIFNALQTAYQLANN